MMMKRSILAGLILLLALCLVSTAVAQDVMVYLDSDPTGASVSVDDHPLTPIGETPIVFDITPGPHTLYLNKIGYQPYSSPILIPDVTFIDLGVITLEPLPPATGGINVVTIPPNATVSIKHTGDGDDQYFPLGKTPLTFSSLIAGDYTVKLELAGYYPLTRDITVSSGSMTEIVEELVKIPTTGFAAFKTVPPGAAVFIGGSFVGTTPLTLELAPGTYPYTFRLDGFQDNSSTFDILTGETTPVEATLNKVLQNVSVYFTSVPAGAKIFIDGNDTGLVTPSVIPIPYDATGTNYHTILFTMPGFKDFSGTLNLNSWFANLDPLYQYPDVTMDPLTITICSNLTNGTITPLGGDPTIIYGEPKTYIIQGDTPDWEIVDYVIDGVVHPLLFNTSILQYDFSPVIENHTICAHFVRYNVTVNASAGPGGEINPSGIFQVPIGSDLILYFEPDDCYENSGYILNGVQYDGNFGGVQFTGIDDDITIQALFTLQTFYVNASSVGGTGDWATPLTQTINCGESATITISPPNDYMILSITDNGAGQSITTSYTIPDVEEDHDVVVTFGPAVFTIDATAGPNGTINPSGDVEVNYLDDQTFTITPGPCYAILDVTVDGEDIGPVTEYTFTDVTADHTISANFTPSEPVITTSVNGEGTITPEGPVDVACGDDQEFALTPDPCYSIAEIEIDDVEIDLTDSNVTWSGPVGGRGVSANYTFEDVTTDHSIEVEFDVAIFNVTTIAGPNGQIEPNNVTVECGDCVTLNFIPDDGYAVGQVLVDGEDYGNPSSIELCNITDDILVEATFVTNAVADFEAVVQPVPEGEPIPLRFLDPVAQPGMDIKFYDLSTGEGIDQWRWDFGDGNYSALQNPIHKYGQTGLYTVSLKVHNAAGWSNPDVKIDYIEITENPLVDFSFEPVTGNVPPSLTVKFADETIDTTGTPHIITWDFGDGSVGPNAVGETTPMHTYTDYGTYTVTLNIDNIIGEGSMSKEIIITANPVADFIGFPTHGNHNLTVQFTDLSQAVVPITTWFWNFGDGEFSTASDPAHTYYTPGKYNVTLNVTTDLGDYNLTKKIFYIDVR